MNSTENNGQSKKQHMRKWWLRFLVFIFLILGIIYFCYWFLWGRFYETTDDAYVSGNQIQVMTQVPGQVIAILADVTDKVTKGQPLVKLDKNDAEIALRQAESQLALTVRQVSQFYKNVDQLKANFTLQQHNYEQAQEDYKRRSGLIVNKVISQEALRHAKIAVSTATASLASAKHQLEAAIALVSNSNLYNHPQILQAEAHFRTAYLNWKRTTIYAPESGFIAKRAVQIGQQVNPNTERGVLMVIVPLNQIWVDANFKESQLKNFRIGQPVELISDLYGSDVKFHGTVVGLSPGTGSSFDLLPPQNATGNWIKIVQRVPVRITIDSHDLEKYPLQIGLSMEATVDTSHRQGQRLTQSHPDKVIYQTKDFSANIEEANQRIAKILKDNALNIQYQ